MKRLLIASILALCLTVLLTPIASAAGISIVSKTGDGTWTGNNWGVELYPGETKTTTIKLYNSSSDYLDVRVTVTPETQDSGNVTFSADDDAFAMTGKSYAAVVLTVEASASTTPGTYSAEFELKFEQAPSERDRRISSLRITDIEVKNITETSARITWDTNRSAKMRLTYSNGDEKTIGDNAYSTYHSLRLEDLESCTEYEFSIKCYDRHGETDIEDGDFKTLCPEPEPPVIEPEPVVEPEPEPETPAVQPEPEAEPPIPPTVEEEAGKWWMYVTVGLVVVALAFGGYLAYRRKRRSTKDE